jgi:hypothetical protein
VFLTPRDERRVNLFVSNEQQDHFSFSITSLSLSLSRRRHCVSGLPHLPYIYLFHSLFSLYPPTHAILVSLVVQEYSRSFRVSHWLPHRPFAQESQQFYCSAASSSPHTQYSCAFIFSFILFTHYFITYSYSHISLTTTTSNCRTVNVVHEIALYHHHHYNDDATMWDAFYHH